jgi:hypothetical protein
MCHKHKVNVNTILSLRGKNGTVKPEMFYITSGCYCLNEGKARTLSVLPESGPAREGFRAYSGIDKLLNLKIAHSFHLLSKTVKISVCLYAFTSLFCVVVERYLTL